MITNYAEARTASISELIEWLENGHRVNGHRPTIREGIDRRISRLTKSEVTSTELARIVKAIDNLPFSI